MKISYNWLKEYLNTDLSPDQLSEVLTSIGLEVDSLEKWESVKGGLEGFVIGLVTECEKHPNADKLSKTKVDVGTGRILDIVCGAPNVAAGQKVVVATEGTIIYSDKGNFEIKKSKIRGEASEGMLCAEDELGLGTSHEGIMVLPDSIAVGTSARKYFNVVEDYIFEIGLTPNRIDAASHIGVARDVAAFLNQKHETKVTFPSVDEFKVENNSLPIQVSIENKEACIRYAGVSISGITVKESPEWLKTHLNSIGLRPINNVVDITNFVLYELGQPLHAFDADQINGKKIIVKTLSTGTKFITLDEQEHSLIDSDLMICDEQGGVALAGIFGGLHSGINESTKNIFIESACFNPTFVRKTSRRLGIFTDASFRFERGSDPNMVLIAMKRAALLVKELAGGNISSEIVDVYPEPVKDFEVDLTYAAVNRLIGKEIGHIAIKDILKSLDIKIEKETTEGLKLMVPPYRVDVKREADVVEEILRIYGYNNIDFPDSVNAVLTYETKPDKDKVVNTIADYLASNGFNEIMNNSLTRSAYYENSETYKNAIVYIRNPLSSDLNCMRQTLLYGTLESVLRNINHRKNNLKLFEFGNTYRLIHSNTSKDTTDKYKETYSLAIAMSGLRNEGNWLTPESPTSFFYMKSYIQAILDRLGISSDKYNVQPSSRPEFSVGLMVEANKKNMVEYGILNKSVSKQFDLKNEVYFAEFNWDIVMQLVAESKTMYRELPRYPEVVRDLALLIDKTVTFAQLKEVAEKTERKLLRSLSLFDVYESDKLDAGKKSYALRFTLLDDNKTLTDQEIEKIMGKFQKAFEREVGAKLR